MSKSHRSERSQSQSHAPQQQAPAQAAQSNQFAASQVETQESRPSFLDSYSWGKIGAIRNFRPGGVVMDVYGDQLQHLDPADIKAGYWKTTLDRYDGEIIERRGPKGVQVWFRDLGMDQADAIVKAQGRDLDFFALWD